MGYPTMNVEEEIMRIQNKINKATSEDGLGQEEVVVLLKQLKDLTVNLEILCKTRIGRTVSDLRRSSKDEAIVSLTKILIRNWKKFISQSNTRKSPSNSEDLESSSSKSKSNEKAEMCENKENVKKISGTLLLPTNTRDPVSLNGSEVSKMNGESHESRSAGPSSCTGSQGLKPGPRNQRATPYKFIDNMASSRLSFKMARDMPLL